MCEKILNYFVKNLGGLNLVSLFCIYMERK